MKAGTKKTTENSSQPAAKKFNQVSSTFAPLKASSDLVAIRITPQLKQKAKHFIESFWQLDYDQESVDICTVTVRCNEPRHAEAISIYAKEHERFIQESLPSLPVGFLPRIKRKLSRTSPLTEAEEPGKEAPNERCYSTVANLHALDLGLEMLASSITQTHLSSLAVKRNLLTVLSRFTEAFSEVISFTVWSSG